MTYATAQCACGHAKIEILRQPKLRYFCHCTMCQKAYGKPCSDSNILRPKDVIFPEDHGILFRRHRTITPAQRGECEKCGQPVVAWFSFGLGMRWAIVSGYALGEQADRVKPSMHVYYGTRQKDIDDGLPKYNNMLSTYIACTPGYLKTLLGL